MATGGSDQSKPGHEGYSWGTDGETIGPPEPQSTLRLSYTGATRTAAGDRDICSSWPKRRHANIVAESS